MKKIKLLYTINFLNNGGPSKVLLNIIKSLDINKYDINILTIIDQNDCEVVRNLRKIGVNVFEIKMQKKIVDVVKYRKQILETIIKLSPDIVHSHGIVTSVLLASNQISCYKMTTIHNNVYEDYKYTYGIVKGRLIAYIHLTALKRFDNIICCSKSSYDVIKDRFDNISYIRNGIDSESTSEIDARNKIRQELEINDNEIVFMYGGVITERKRVLQLVKMFNINHNDNEKLLIVGEGPLLHEIKKYADKDIKILGYKKNILDYMCASDIYISYSDSEGLSISVIEALEQGLGLLLSDIPSHKEFFEIDCNYFIGTFFNESDFYEKKIFIVDNLININKNKEFKQRYLSSKSMTNEYEKIYKRHLQ